MRTSLKPKHQRLVLAIIALVALIGAGLLAAWALRNQASYFYVPTEIVANPPEPERPVRLGGMVQQDSISRAGDGVTVRFVVGDGEAQVPVHFAGIVPALFEEGSGVVAEGRMGTDGIFIADNLLARHDENYIPRELEHMTEAQAEATVAETFE